MNDRHRLSFTIVLVYGRGTKVQARFAVSYFATLFPGHQNAKSGQKSSTVEVEARCAVRQRRCRRRPSTSTVELL